MGAAILMGDSKSVKHETAGVKTQANRWRTTGTLGNVKIVAIYRRNVND
jgi:hypothetical protein